MPFCTVFENDIDTDMFSFEGFFHKGGDIIYAAVKFDSDIYEQCRNFESFGVHRGRSLFAMPDFLTLCTEHYDIAVYKHNDLYGFVETQTGKIITAALFSDVQPFYSYKYTKVCYPGGRYEFIDTTGKPFLPGGYGDLLDVYSFQFGCFYARKELYDGSVLCGAIDADGSVLVDFKWDMLSTGKPWYDGLSHLAIKDGRCFFLNTQGKIREDLGGIFDGPCEFQRDEKDLNKFWWNVSIDGIHGRLFPNGLVVVGESYFFLTGL